MTIIKAYLKNDPAYEEAYDFAKEKYKLPRMRMELYYRPSVLFVTLNQQNKITGVMGLNVGFVANTMFSEDPRVADFMSQPNACDQSIFALDDSGGTIAPYALAGMVAIYAHHQQAKHLGVLAIPISRKIMKKLGIETLKDPKEVFGFGKPDITLLPEEQHNNWKTWFEFNEPTSLEIVDLKQAHRPCIEMLNKFIKHNKLTADENLKNLLIL